MAHSLPLGADNLDAADMETAIMLWLAEMEKLRQQMRRRDAAIEETSKETQAVLADVAQILAELKPPRRAMLKQLYELTKTLFGLTQDTQRNKAQIEELQREMKAVSETVRDLAFEMRRMRADDAHEREKMALRLENGMLRFERRLLSQPSDSGRPPDADASQGS